MRVALCGRFTEPWTAECDFRRTLQGLGHEVIPIPENLWNGRLKGEPWEPGRRRSAPVGWGDFELFAWVSTYGWAPDNERMLAFLAECRERGVPTVAYHLDIWRGLRRAFQVETLAHFRCQYFFSGDGGSPEFWESRGINHRYLLPAVLEDSCYLGAPDPRHDPEIVFIGSRQYHQEHPWRRRMLDYLERTYGPRFRIYEHSSGMRGERLSRLLVSARVTVGDSCFAGLLPGYTSDRLYESLGRGARLVYPEIAGVTDGAPCITHRPDDLGSLREAVELALSDSPDEARAERESAVAWTRSAHTYRHRWQEIFRVLRAEGALIEEGR